MPVPAFRYVPEGFDAADLPALESLANAVIDRPVGSAPALERWIEDWAELQRAVFAGATRRRIAMTRDTADGGARSRYVAYQRETMPVWRRLEDRWRRRLLADPHRTALDGRFAVWLRQCETRAAIFAARNVDLLARDAELGTRYFALAGGLRASFEGESVTLQAAARHLDDPDRARRERAWRAVGEARERAWRAVGEARIGARDEAEAIFDEMLALRHDLARNADLDTYVDYRFRELCRFDYTPDDCRAFHDAVEEHVVPVLRRRRELRRARDGRETVRPWDIAFQGGSAPWAQDEAGLVRDVHAVFGAVDPAFAAEFDILVRNDLLDLWTRPGKAPGGYNAGLADIRLPFIFGNAAGGRNDLRLMLHEGGHAFHTIATRDEPVLDIARAPIEFCEVASMAMEMFGAERATAIYAERDAAGLLAGLIESRLRLFAWVATIDSFQHWVYAHPGHTRADREAAWIERRTRFEPDLDWSGIEEVRAAEWTGQQHLFNHALYYVEYALAWMGAVQVWERFRADPAAGVAGYRTALALGGSRPLPELFAAAGARFGTDGELVRTTVAAMERRLDELTSR